MCRCLKLRVFWCLLTSDLRTCEHDSWKEEVDKSGSRNQEESEEADAATTLIVSMATVHGDLSPSSCGRSLHSFVHSEDLVQIRLLPSSEIQRQKLHVAFFFIER